MDNYLKTLNLKMNFIINMVKVFGIYKVDISWFDISIANTDASISKNGLHEYGTSFKMVSLLDKYSIDFHNILKSNNILFERSRNCLIFKAGKL